MAVLGLDVGTSSVKAILVGENGLVQSSRRAGYPTTRGPGGVAEQDPDDYLEAMTEAVRQLDGDLSTVTGIGLAGHTPTAVFVDRAHRPARSAMTWQDTRAGAESDELSAEICDATALFGTPLAWTPTALPAKLLWVSRHQPEVVRATRWVLQPKDYLGLHLTGEPTTDAWSSKGLCNVLSGDPATAFLERVGWTAEHCPRTGAPWAARGTLLAEPAQRLGLPAGIPVSVGWSDALTAMLRVGAFRSPRSFILTGTSDIVGRTAADEPAATPGLLSVPEECAPLPVRFGPTQSSGDALEWLARVLGRSIPELLAAPPEAPGAPPVFLPYLRGERAPLWNAEVRGAFLNLSADHGVGDLVDAVLLGIGFSARHVLDQARSLEALDDAVHIAGASTTSERWTDARLSTLGASVSLHAESNPSAAGAAALGAAAAGESIDAVVSRMLSTAERREPTPEQRDRAAAGYATYREASAFAIALSERPAPS